MPRGEDLLNFLKPIVSEKRRDENDCEQATKLDDQMQESLS